MELYIDNARSLFGIVFILLLAWGGSSSRGSVPYRAVLIALAIQASIGVLVFAVPGLQEALSGVTQFVAALQTA
ncbi:MAG: Na+ dependent nucleoside transporter N-terminal domain-containing protein, partial [Pseudomonadota bacterium]